MADPNYRTRFGAQDRPPCSQCGAPMVVSRRTPDPHRGSAYELQMLTCSDCNHEMTRVVDEDGKTVA